MVTSARCTGTTRRGVRCKITAQHNSMAAEPLKLGFSVCAFHGGIPLVSQMTDEQFLVEALNGITLGDSAEDTTVQISIRCEGITRRGTRCLICSTSTWSVASPPLRRGSRFCLYHTEQQNSEHQNAVSEPEPEV